MAKESTMLSMDSLAVVDSSSGLRDSSCVSISSRIQSSSSSLSLLSFELSVAWSGSPCVAVEIGAGSLGSFDAVAVWFFFSLDS